MTEKRRTTRPAHVSPIANDRYPPTLEAGCSDAENGSIDAAAKLALSDDPQEYCWALRLLRDMAEFKRGEAAVFLIGLLMTCGDNWEKRLAIVEMLHPVKSDACVDVLIGELRRVRSVNSTRRYLQGVLDTLACLPPELVRPGLIALSADGSLTPWVRGRLQVAIDALD